MTAHGQRGACSPRADQTALVRCCGRRSAAPPQAPAGPALAPGGACAAWSSQLWLMRSSPPFRAHAAASHCAASMLDMSEEAGGARRSALSPTYPTGAARARAQGLYHSEEGGEAGVTEVAAHQLYTAPGWAEPVWRNVVPPLPRHGAARARALQRRGCARAPASPARPCPWPPARRPPLAAAHPRAHRPRALRSNPGVQRLAAASRAMRRLSACTYSLRVRMYTRLPSTLSSPGPVPTPQRRGGSGSRLAPWLAGDASRARHG